MSIYAVFLLLFFLLFFLGGGKKTIIQSIENELEVMVRVDEVRTKYLRHMEE